MSADWRSVRITFICAPEIDWDGPGDLLMQINHLVHARYPDQVANVCVELLEPAEFRGRVRGSSREGPAGA